MPGITTLAGCRLAPYEATVDRRATMSYAAGTGHEHPRYYDDDAPGGLVAPPLFAVALTWPLLETLPARLGAALPPAAVPRLVHASEHLVFHSLVRPGQRVTIAGEVAALEPLSAGTMMYLRLRATTKDDRPLFTETIGVLFRGVSSTQKAVDDWEPPRQPSLAKEETPAWSAAIPIGREAPFVYDACANIVFAIHTSSAFARAAGLPDVLLQGTATLAMAAREIVDRECDGDPARLRTISGRFRGMVVPGGAIRVRLDARSDDGRWQRFTVLNAEDRPAITDAYARVTAEG